jgi:choice-of-anchor B domain-containing protein
MRRLCAFGAFFIAATSLSAQGFGTGVALAGDNVFIGRPAIVPGFPMPPSAAGAVHVFRLGASGWSESAMFAPAAGSVGDGFGSALAADGMRVLVGAPNIGVAYVFEWRQNAWLEVARLAAPAAQEGDRFGATVLIQGDWALVGAPGRDEGRGAVYAFTRRGTEWQPMGVLLPSDRPDGSAFGSALAKAGDMVYVGAPGPTPLGGMSGGPPPGAGRVVTFTHQQRGEWREGGTLQVADSAVRSFGMSLLVDGAALLVGAPASHRGAGMIVRFTRSAQGWAEAGRIRPAQQAPGLIGMSLAKAGDDLLAGAPVAGGLGQIVVFRGANAEWTEAARLGINAQGLIGLMGIAVGSGPALAVTGAPGADFFEGVGYAFTRASDGTWSEATRIVNAAGGGLAAISGGETRCTDGQAGTFGCERVSLQSFLPKEALGAQRGIMTNDLWGWADPDTQREYALVGLMDRTTFVDVTDPSNPVILGWLPLHQGAQPNLWRDIKVYRNHAFIVSDGAGPHGMQVFDLTQLRTVRGGTPVVFEETAHYAGIASAHNIVINEETGFAYSVGSSSGGETCGGALHMIDIRDPRNPQFAGCHADPATGRQRTGYTHDAQCVVYAGPDATYRGREVCFSSSETALGIADVTDKMAPRPIANASYPNVGYSHQGWLSDDHRHFFLNDELDELSGNAPRTRTIVWDVADLDDPVVLTEFMGTTPASDHNLYVHGRYMYQSNYVAGLRIIDIADPANPVEVGFFDTVPWGQDAPGFAGTWSNYPYFPSGNIIVNSMREGLFVLKFTPPAMVP